MSLDSGSQIITSEPATVPNAGPSFHRASIHFAASLTAPSSEQALCGATHDTMAATTIADDMKRRIELVAQAIHDAQPSAFAWDAEPAFDRERYREYARNAIKLLGEEIGVLLFSLGEVAAEQHVG
jgi:hypothetical protein